ncbi:MAG: hypothetical protein HOV86_27530, partial [Thermoactinospora sp.]|nr:hypothetical protein [Thermoactinospora sp.]
MNWDDLASTALVGTDRRPYRGELLLDAAVEVARRRAGRRPGELAAVSPAPGEELPAVERRA